MLLSPSAVQKFFDNNGRPMAGGLLYTYAAGTSDKIATYKNQAGSEQNTNPIELDFRGECRLWLDPNLAYKFVLSPPGDTDPPTNPIWTVDDVTAPASQGGARALGYFSASLDATQTEGVAGINWSCAEPGIYEVVFEDGLFSSPPIVTATALYDSDSAAICELEEVTAAHAIIRVKDHNNGSIDRGVHFHAFEIVA